MKCERCDREAKGFEVFDYCAVCGANFCAKCMAEGHCKNVPALSGMKADGLTNYSDNSIDALAGDGSGEK